MTFARTAHQWVAWVAVAMLPVLFLLAGLGTLGGEDVEAHKVLGSLLKLAAILLLALAIVGAMGRTAIVRNAVLVLLVFGEASLASHELAPQWIRSFHVPGAMLVAFALSDTARRAGIPWRGQSTRAQVMSLAPVQSDPR